MRFQYRWHTALCSGLVLLAACDSSHMPLAARPDAGDARRSAVSAGLVAFYSFDVDAGDGTVSGATHLPAGGYEGGAFHFDGDGAFIDLPVNVNPSARRSVTIGAWVRVESLPAGRPAQVLSHDDGGFDRGIALDYRTAGGMLSADPRHRFSAFTGSGVLPGPVADTARWVFVAAVYDEGVSVDLYVDGVSEATLATPGDGTRFLRVGGNPFAGEAFHGVIDNVFVYDRTLLPDEIERIRLGGACAITGACQQPPQPPQAPRVAFYPFDAGAGDGTVRGARHDAAGGYQGGAYYFDGKGAYIDLPVDVNPAAMPQVTMGAWVRTASVPAGLPAQVLSHDDGGFDRSIALDVRGPDGWSEYDGDYHFAAFTGSGVLPGTVVFADTWTFVAAVYDGTRVTFYVDGAEYSEWGAPGAGGRALRVGGNPAGSISGEPFHGWIDNVFVIDRALTDAEVADIRAGGACAFTGGSCNRAPVVAVGGPYTVDEGSPVSFSFSAADPDGDALSFSWDLGDGTLDTGALPTWHEYADDGTYPVSVTAADPAGLSATQETTVQVANVRPAVNPVRGASLVDGEVYTAPVSFTDPGADRWSATVDYGDGSPPQALQLSGRTAVLSHRYAAPGAYTVRVAVRDDDDATPGTATASVTVSSLGGAMANATALVSAAVASGELTQQQADRLAGHFTSASSFLDRADTAATPQQEAAMLRAVLRNLNQVLSSLPAGGTNVAALRDQTLRLRAAVQARLAAV